MNALFNGQGLADAAMIAAIVISATIGDVLLAAAMRGIGDLDEIRARSGMGGAIAAVLGNARFVSGVFFMALSFFSLLFALSHADLSLIAPAATSLTFVTNAVAAKIFSKRMSTAGAGLQRCLCAPVWR